LVGLLLSFTGSFMQNAAILWHVSLLVAPERKGLALGLVGLVASDRFVLFSLVSRCRGGRAGSRRLMLFHAGRLDDRRCGGSPLLTVRGLSAVWPIYVLGRIELAVGAFDLPARPGARPVARSTGTPAECDQPEHDHDADASVAGPALGGVIIATTRPRVGLRGERALVQLRDSRAVDDARSPRAGSAGRPAHETMCRCMPHSKGCRFRLSGLRLIRSTMLLDFLRDVFLVGDRASANLCAGYSERRRPGYGWLFAAPAVGALITSAAMVPLTERIERAVRTLIWAVLGYGAATVLFGISRSFWVPFACLALTGANRHGQHGDSANIVRQLETPDRLRGRMTGRQHGVLRRRAATR